MDWKSITMRAIEFEEMMNKFLKDVQSLNAAFISGFFYSLVRHK